MHGPLLRDDCKQDGWFLPDDLSHFLDLVWAVCGITVDLFALGRFVAGLHPHNLAGVVVNDGVDGLVEHVGPTVDSRQPRESLNEVQVGSKHTLFSYAHIPSKSLNVYDFGMKIYTSQPISPQLLKEKRAVIG